MVDSLEDIFFSLNPASVDRGKGKGVDLRKVAEALNRKNTNKTKITLFCIANSKSTGFLM